MNFLPCEWPCMNSTLRHVGEPGVLLIVLFIAISTGMLSCKKPAKDRSEKSAADSPATPVEVKPAMKFKTVTYVDRDGIGTEAFRLVIPSDWKFAGGITWRLDNPGMPAVGSFRVFNPSDVEEIEGFPNQGFFWTTNPMVLQMFPVGSRYFGNEVRRPMTILSALQQIAVPRFRGAAKNLRIVSSQELPGLAQTLGAGSQSQSDVPTSAQGGKVRLEYLIRRQIQQIRSVGELSRIISQTHNEISDMMMQSYNERQGVYDRVAENFSQHIRGVDEYYDPVEEKPVELPAGYGHAWVNGLGEYVVSDDPNYNPNIGSNMHWQEMKKK